MGKGIHETEWGMPKPPGLAVIRQEADTKREFLPVGEKMRRGLGKLGELSVCKASLDGVEERERNWVGASRLTGRRRQV